MERYAAFLRGINVNGINIKMADLKQAFVQLNFENVRTVLATGNVVFETDDTDPAELKGRIEAQLAATFHYEAWVIVLAWTDLERIARACPFSAEQDDRHAYVMFTADEGALNELLAQQGQLDPAQEQIVAGQGALYWEVKRGFTTESAFGKYSSKPRFKASTTTRNLRTLHKVLG